MCYGYKHYNIIIQEFPYEIVYLHDYNIHLHHLPINNGVSCMPLLFSFILSCFIIKISLTHKIKVWVKFAGMTDYHENVLRLTFACSSTDFF